MNAWEVLCTATMEAAARIVYIQKLNVDAGKLTESMRRVIKAAIPRIMSEWKDGIDANLGESWLRQMVNAQATELALEAINTMEV